MGPATSIGIVGGGQLAWMLAEAARRRGVELHVQTPGAQDPAVALATSVVQAEVRDASATRELAKRCSAISFENEWVDLEGLKALAADGVPFVPDLEALRPLVCKRSQRELLNRFNLPSPAWFPLDRVQEVPEEIATGEDSAASSAPKAAEVRPQPPQGFAYPLMAKAASGGYDGKGTAVLRNDDDLEALLERVEASNWIVEEFVAFDLELGVVAARDQIGDVQGL